MVKTKTQIIEKLETNREAMRRYGVNRVGLFGSFVRNEQQQDSDIDLLVEFLPGKKTYRNFIGFAQQSETILGRKVDVVTDKGVSQFLKPYIYQEVEYVQVN